MFESILKKKTNQIISTLGKEQKNFKNLYQKMKNKKIFKI